MTDPRSRPSNHQAQVDQATEWGELLRNVDLQDALSALNTHLTTSPEVVKPYHILEGVKRIVAEHNHRQASTKPVEHHRGWHPAPSREVMALIGTRALANDPVAVARFKTAYRDELIAAGFDPDTPEGGAPRRPPSWDGRGQGKDFAIPVHDRD